MNVKVLFRKDLKELIVSKKMLILLGVFVFFALSGPLSAKFEPELMKAYSSKLGPGSIINVPAPVYTDAYKDTFNNLKQAGIIVVILLVCSTIVDEKRNGTAAFLLTKGLSRSSFLLSKIASRVLIFTLACGAASFVCILYTFIIFGEFSIPNLYLAFLLYWIYGVFIICVSILVSVLARTFTQAFFAGFVAYFVISLLNMVPYLNRYLPGRLNTIMSDILSEKTLPDHWTIPLGITLLLSILSVLLSQRIFKEQEL
ncbi:ABC transporter permease subunit [Paenibacillus tritici]|uniref:ABC transporter permease subunit n=1 Tax=Paenibacillus tritici TaxID=1873425 RepID=A0ABX2DVF8_9BACL|nr:ABC transporter permease subunit [Paenibacillus tritici]NQX47421.1 ABC transporter permease subunit [Paenibacillus tritici]